MSAIYILVGFSLIIALVFLVAFMWSVKNGQYEDEYTPSIRILFEEDNTHHYDRESSSIDASNA